MQRFIYITRILACSFLVLLIALNGIAQEGQNPFDLEHRLKEKKEQNLQNNKDTVENPFDLEHRNAEDAADQKDPPETQKTANPFDKSTTPVALPESGDKSASVSTLQNKKSAQQEESSGFVFWAMLLLLIFLALEITLYKSLINKVYRAFTNDNILKLLHREQRNVISFPYLLLYIFFFVSFGIFTFLAFNYFGFIPRRLDALLYCITGIGLLFFLKHVLLKIVEIIFPVQKEIKQYSFSMVIFSSILGIALVPFNIVIAFASPSLVKFALFGGLITIFGITVFCILRGLFLASKYLSFHKFHFFMYLCTVEIAPVLVVVKILLLKAGIH